MGKDARLFEMSMPILIFVVAMANVAYLDVASDGLLKLKCWTHKFVGPAISSIFYFIVSSAWLTSAMISSMFSIPTDILTKSSLTPALANSSALSCLWVVDAG
jgi:hypothetical protein